MHEWTSISSSLTAFFWYSLPPKEGRQPCYYSGICVVVSNKGRINFCPQQVLKYWNMKVGMIIIFVIPAADGIKTILTFLSCPAKLSFNFDTTESNLDCSNGVGGIWCTSERRTIKCYGTCNSAVWIAVITEKCLLVQVHLCSSVPAGSWRYHSFLIDLALLLQDQQ